MKCPEGSKESEIDRLSLASTRATPREERTGGSVLRACVARASFRTITLGWDGPTGHVPSSVW